VNDLDIHLSAIAAGDTSAFARWVAGCEMRLRASLSSFAAVIDVEAVVQETLLRVWQLAPRIEIDGKGESSVRFAIRVARNLAISEVRRLAGPARALQLQSQHQTDEPSRGAAIEPDPLLRKLIVMCRDKLRGKPAAALNQRLTRSELPDRELAASIGMQLNAFLQNVGRARKAIASCLKKQGVQLEAVL
jgi:DNA-directed RNA polymerase specialized sigma24 family protein